MNKKLPTINFKGKEYVTVVERVKYFNETFPKGFIKNELISAPEADRVIVKSTIYTEGRVFSAHSQAKWSDTSSFVNKMSALENAETSAVGRALALMGIGVTDSIASMDEINKANQTLQKISSGQNFTADEFEEAVEVDAPMAFEATKQASKDWREANPPVKRNPGIQYGKKATSDRLREAGVPIVNQDL